jgi:hypothetical protein
MRSMRLLAVAVLAVVLALSSAQNAFSSQEISYDTGAPMGDWGHPYVGVKFSLPTGVSSVHLLAVSFYWMEPPDSVQGAGMVMAMSPQARPKVVVHITGVPPSTTTELTSSISVTPIGGWNPLDVSSSNIVVSGDFYVAIEQPISDTVAFDSSSSNFEGRSVYGDSLDTMTNLCCGSGTSRNFMIRAEIDPIVSPAPVGGFMEPVNKVAVFAPYLALFGVIGVVAVVLWKRPDN